MKQLFIVLFSLITVFCISCHRNKSAQDDILIAEDGSKSKKVVIEQNSDNTPKVVYYYKLDKDGNTTQEVTREEHFYLGGKKYIEGNIKQGERNGKWFAYFQDGSVQVSAFYVSGLEHGEYNVFRENGKPYYTGQYNMGICIGEWKWYDEKGNVTESIMAEGDNLACRNCPRCIAIKLNQ
jgi:antitoxin component YwqK of YwqJK toxin-antitoxin module